MGVMPNVNFVHSDVIDRMTYYITHQKLKMLSELTSGILTDDRVDARETKEILAEDIAKLEIIKNIVDELLEIANSTICDNMARELKEIAEEEKRREEERKEAAARRKAAEAVHNTKSECVVICESEAAK